MSLILHPTFHNHTYTSFTQLLKIKSEPLVVVHSTDIRTRRYGLTMLVCGSSLMITWGRSTPHNNHQCCTIAIILNTVHLHHFVCTWMYTQERRNLKAFVATKRPFNQYLTFGIYFTPKPHTNFGCYRGFNL